MSELRCFACGLPHPVSKPLQFGEHTIFTCPNIPENMIVPIPPEEAL